mgnify:CR=1 FL=1
MKFSSIILLYVAANAHRLNQRSADEVDDLLDKQDEKYAQAIADKYVNIKRGQ